MQDTIILQKYVNNFRRHLSQYLKPGIGVECIIHPIIQDGAIIEFTMSPTIGNTDSFLTSQNNINAALATIKQNAFGGNLTAFKFSGTNIINEKNRLIIIKGGDEKADWDDQCARADVMKLVPVKVSSA